MNDETDAFVDENSVQREYGLKMCTLKMQYTKRVSFIIHALIAIYFLLVFSKIKFAWKIFYLSANP